MCGCYFLRVVGGDRNTCSSGVKPLSQVSQEGTGWGLERKEAKREGEGGRRDPWANGPNKYLRSLFKSHKEPRVSIFITVSSNLGLSSGSAGRLFYFMFGGALLLSPSMFRLGVWFPVVRGRTWRVDPGSLEPGGSPEGVRGPLPSPVPTRT